MNAKLLGGILLVSGTCIGGGMLGLPIATAKGGVLGSSILFIGCWLLMTVTALLTLEVNLCFPPDSHIISMAKITLGRLGEIVCWTLYLLFLYALVSAYIAGGQDVLHGFFTAAGMPLPLYLCSFIFVFVFGAVVMSGIRNVDMFNRFLMLAKLLIIFLLMLFIALHIDINNYSFGHVKYLLPAFTVAITSFGFSIIVPSLRTYFNEDIKQLRLAIIIGSLLPLVCYIIWDTVIFGLIPLAGDFGLERLLNSSQPVTELLASIIYYVPTNSIIILSRAFTSICILTAFACVSLGLSDYLADGFKINKTRIGKVFLTFATFLPPMLVVIFYPKAFILLLSVAGLLSLILQALMPAIMAWNCRYIQQMESEYRVRGGKTFLLLTMLMSIVGIGISTYYMF